MLSSRQQTTQLHLNATGQGDQSQSVCRRVCLEQRQSRLRQRAGRPFASRSVCQTACLLLEIVTRLGSDRQNVHFNRVRSRLLGSAAARELTRRTATPIE